MVEGVSGAERRLRPLAPPRRAQHPQPLELAERAFLRLVLEDDDAPVVERELPAVDLVEQGAVRDLRPSDGALARYMSEIVTALYFFPSCKTVAWIVSPFLMASALALWPSQD